MIENVHCCPHTQAQIMRAIYEIRRSHKLDRQVAALRCSDFMNEILEYFMFVVFFL